MFNLRSLDLNLLTVFEAIYELGTVSSAADRLALSQSATSHALARLREACNDELFVRTRLGLSPTPVAKEMYPAINKALDSLRATLTEASSFDPARSKRQFRISIPHPMGPFYALFTRSAVAAMAPDISLSFDTVTLPVNLENDLRGGIIDIAIDWLPIELGQFANKKLFDDRLVLVVRNGNPSVNAEVTMEDLGKREFVSLHRRGQIESTPTTIRELYKLGLNVVLYVSELLEVPTLVASTDLLGIFPASMAPLLERRLGLRVLALPIELPGVPIYMIWHQTRSNDAAHCWLRELVVAELCRRAFDTLAFDTLQNS